VKFGLRITFLHPSDFFNRVQGSGMIPSPELVPDGHIGRAQELAAKEHGYLPGISDGVGPGAFGQGRGFD
jgi:hypothetical protein